MKIRNLIFRAVAPLAALIVLGAASPSYAAGSEHVIKITAGNSGPQHLIMGQDKAAIVELDTNARDVLVSNPAIVDAVVRSPRRIFLLAGKVGQTNAFFFDSAGQAARLARHSRRARRRRPRQHYRAPHAGFHRSRSKR